MKVRRGAGSGGGNARGRQGAERSRNRPGSAPRSLPAGPASAFEARPRRSLGQNFLADPNVARKIVAALRIEPGDTVVEIGPGRGALTGFLLESGAQAILALEKDPALALELKRRHPALLVVAADALATPWERLGELAGPSAGVRVVGNLPYNVASPIIWDLASRARGLARAVFMVQNEVADRMVAKPRTKAYGALTVWLGSFARVEKLFVVGPEVFRPRPRVDSAVVALSGRDASLLPESPTALAGFVKRLFSQRRKQLGAILGKTIGPGVKDYLESQGLSLRARPEELDPNQIASLLKYF